MQENWIEKIIPLLVKGKPMAYALKADGRLVIIDANGQKRSFEAAEYRHLLKPAPAKRKTPADAGNPAGEG